MPTSGWVGYVQLIGFDRNNKYNSHGDFLAVAIIIACKKRSVAKNMINFKIAFLFKVKCVENLK